MSLRLKAMFIASRNAANKILENCPDLQLSGEAINISTNEKLLGVHIDNSLSWTVQIENTIKKCNSLLYLLNRIKHYLPITTRKLFFNAYVLPHVDYCCTVWGNISSNLTDSMIKLQKRAARIILDKGIDHTCDQTRYRRDLPILGPRIRVTPDRPKLPIYMNSNFLLLPKAKTCFLIFADACFI